MTAEEFHKRLNTVIWVRDAVRGCQDIEDRKSRAAEAAVLVKLFGGERTPSLRASVEAFASLSTCGEEALPHLHEMLTQELAYWKQTAPGLDYGWWNKDDNRKYLRELLRSLPDNEPKEENSRTKRR
jgi:hypothetical protein